VDPEIKRYLDGHGATYTRDALRASLVAAGHDPAAVDAALSQWEATRSGTGADTEKRMTFGRWAIGLHVAALVAVFILIVGLKGTTAVGVALLGCVVLGVALVLGWLISSLIGRALLPGAGVIAALIVPAISALLLGGTCFALLNSAIGTPPRQGTVHLEILLPRAFDGSGDASCYVGGGSAGVQVNSQSFGTLDDKPVSVSLGWYSDDPNNPAPGKSTSIWVSLEATGEGEKGPVSFGVIFSTKLNVDAAPDGLTGTIRFEGLAAGPTGAPGQPSTPEVISGSVSWNCE
jgi:hypothetical protein